MILKTSSRILKIHPKDNIVVALCDLNKGLTIQIDAGEFQLVTNVASKHKLSIENFSIGDSIFMYGVVVGKAVVLWGILLCMEFRLWEKKEGTTP